MNGAILRNASIIGTDFTQTILLLVAGLIPEHLTTAAHAAILDKLKHEAPAASISAVAACEAVFGTVADITATCILWCHRG